MVEVIVFHSGNPAWNTCKTAIGVAKKMEEKFGDKVDVHIYTTDSEEAKPFNFRSATNVLVDKEIISIDVATNEKAMEEFLTAKM